MLGFAPLAGLSVAETQALRYGDLAATDAPDLAALAGTALLPGVLAALEPPDTAALVGTALLGTGALAALEPSDAAAFAGVLSGTITPRPAPPPSACLPSASRDFCPTALDLEPQYLAMLPRGRAWAEGGAGREPGGIIYGFVYALAITFAVLHQAICAMALEFFCATRDVTSDAWLAEYGLPDPCDPYPNVCAKVAAQGGATCEAYQAVAAALGWSILCGEGCALDAGCIEAGMVPGPTYSAATLFVIVSLADSPAYANVQIFGPVAGFLEAGMAPQCIDISPLDCVLQRIVGAHLQIEYTVVTS
jgi:hypothetical protein